MDFPERCALAAQCLPDAEYRTRLEILHVEMLHEIGRLGVQLNHAHAHNAAEAEDAARYRWLRDKDGAFERFAFDHYISTTPGELDSAIDAAIATNGAAVGAA